MSNQSPFRVDGQAVPFRPGETVLESLLRGGQHPTGGGSLCCTGDCPHCVATVDGVAYVRTCQVAATAGMEVQLEHRGGGTPTATQISSSPGKARASRVAVRHLHVDVLVIGAGAAGCRAAAERQGDQQVVLLEGRASRARAAREHRKLTVEVLCAEAVGVYNGPVVLARAVRPVAAELGPAEMLQIRVAREIVVATGAGWIHPVCPGSDARGLYTPDAAEKLQAAGVDLGQVVVVRRQPPVDGEPSFQLDGTTVIGRPVAFHQREGQVEAVSVHDGVSTERHPADSVVLALGRQPRDTLARMAGPLPVTVTVVGAASEPVTLPDAPDPSIGGVVCPCSQVTAQALEDAYERGFTNIELLKRATLAGTGTCQGNCCTPHLRSFLEARRKQPEPAFTARPVARQLTLREFAAGTFHAACARTALYDEHERLGARFERSGGWWRPWTYGDFDAEVRAVRTAVSLGDVSTLGKFLVSGPDALAFLEHVFPSKISTLRVGRTRYCLLLDERGVVIDDGMVCRDSETRFYVTLSTGGATFGELWFRDWIEAKGFEVRLLDVTQSHGAINVTGPQAARLLVRAGARDLPPFAGTLETTVGGVPCRVLRLSFTGELSYELHHDASFSVQLWRTLIELGSDLDSDTGADLGSGLGCRPHGLEALLALRLEKAHLIVGKDTDFDSTPRRLRHQWAVRRGDEGDDFVGRAALERTGGIELDRELVGLETELPVPSEGAVLWSQLEGASRRYAGYVTSAGRHSERDRAVLLGWVSCEHLESEATGLLVDGRPATVVEPPFYDPEHQAARAKVDLEALVTAEARSAPPRAHRHLEVTERFERLAGLRVVARPRALREVEPLLRSRIVLRVAEDELLVLDGRMPSSSAPEENEAVEALAKYDPHALVLPDFGYAGRWLESELAHELLQRTCSWQIPEVTEGTAGGSHTAQGAIAGLPCKLWVTGERILLLTSAVYAADLERRVCESYGEAW